MQAEDCRRDAHYRLEFRRVLFRSKGDLVLKFDREYDAAGARRTYSDGKRQRLEDLIPAMINTLERWAISVKRRREERAEQKRQWEEQDRKRKDIERDRKSTRLNSSH